MMHLDLHIVAAIKSTKNYENLSVEFEWGKQADSKPWTDDRWDHLWVRNLLVQQLQGKYQCMIKHCLPSLCTLGLVVECSQNLWSFYLPHLIL